MNARLQHLVCMQVHYTHCKKNFSSLQKNLWETICTRYEVTTISFSTDLDEAQVELKWADAQPASLLQEKN